MKIQRFENQKEYTPATNGWHNGTCCDIVDLGLQTGKFGTKHKLRIVFVIDENDPKTGEPLFVSDFMTASIHEASKLTRYIQCLMPGSKVGKSFDPDDLITMSCRVRTEIHLTKDDRSFANIVSILPRSPGRPDHFVVKIPDNFVRQQDKPQKTNTFTNAHGLQVSDEDVAFPTDVREQDKPRKTNTHGLQISGGDVAFPADVK